MIIWFLQVYERLKNKNPKKTDYQGCLFWAPFNLKFDKDLHSVILINYNNNNNNNNNNKEKRFQWMKIRLLNNYSQFSKVLLPSRTSYDSGKGTPKTQWAAVTMWKGVISVPPHLKMNCPLASSLIRSSTCQGHECGIALSPDTILDICRVPQGRFSNGESALKEANWITMIIALYFILTLSHKLVSPLVSVSSRCLD